MSTAVHRSPKNLGDLTPYLIYGPTECRSQKNEIEMTSQMRMTSQVPMTSEDKGLEGDSPRFSALWRR